MPWTVQLTCAGQTNATESDSGFSCSFWVNPSDPASVSAFVLSCKNALAAYQAKTATRTSIENQLATALNA